MEDKIVESEAYVEFEQRHNRYLNMLAEEDRALRKQALLEFRKSVNANKDPKVLEFFYRQRLCKRTVLTLEDQVEKNREVAIEIMMTMVEHAGFKEEAQIILPAVAARMGKTPFPEPCKYP